MLVLDEKQYAEINLLKNKKYGNYLKLKDAIILAKYFRWVEGKETREIKRILIDISKRLDKNWNFVKQHWKIDAAIKESKKRRIRQSIPIPITQRELENINKLNDFALERICFLYLAYGKILKYNETKVKPKKKPRQIGLFYTNEKPQVIFEKAGVNVRKKERNEMIHNLFLLGMIDSTRFGGILLKYTDENSPTVLMIDNYENIVLYYRQWKGEQVGICSCGRLFLKKSPNEKFCHQCKQRRRRESHQDWLNRRRGIDKVPMGV